MSDMASFFTVMLRIVADFLGAEPIIYLFGLVLLTLLVEIFRRLLSP